MQTNINQRIYEVHALLKEQEGDRERKGESKNYHPTPKKNKAQKREEKEIEEG